MQPSTILGTPEYRSAKEKWRQQLPQVASTLPLNKVLVAMTAKCLPKKFWKSKYELVAMSVSREARVALVSHWGVTLSRIFFSNSTALLNIAKH
jgi:hypothetical protein